MGMSVAASSAIIFVGFMFVATVMFTALNATITGIEKNINDAQDRRADQANTVMHVDNATRNATTVFINITNQGTSTLKVSGLDILINGTLKTSKIAKHNVSGSTTTNIWAPNERLYLEVTTTSSAGMRIGVVAENGKSAYGVLT